jgi:hypothetical protein
MAAADRRPVAAWAGVALGVSLVVALPGDILGGTADYLLGPAPFYWFLALPFALLMLGAAALAGYAVSDLPRRWFGWSRKRSAGTALLVGVAGLTPWLVPHGPSLWHPERAPGWAAACWVAGLLALPAAALLLLPGRQVRATGAVGLLLLAGVWGWARHGWLAAESHAAYLALGSPPRALLRVVGWEGAVPAAVSYRDGRVSIEYDQPTPLPVPDGSQVATLVTERLPNGRGVDAVCTEGRTVSALAPHQAGTVPDLSAPCRDLGSGLFNIGTHTLVRQDGDTLLFLVVDGDLSGDLRSLIRVLDSEHVATDSEILDLVDGANLSG